MHIGVIGINHKLAPLALRETIAKACARRFSLGNPLLDGTFVLLSTCNRSELYFHASSLSSGHEEILSILKEEIEGDFDQKLYTLFGLDCFLHLAKVTAGLDSAIIAETEIQGQVKSAYELAAQQRHLSKDLHFLFQKCLKIAKEVRREHLIGCQVPDLEQALFWYAHEYFQDTLPAPLFIGTSEINLKIARFFQQRGIGTMYICNRTDSTSVKVAKTLGINHISWNSIQTNWQDYPWIICATKSPHYLLHNANGTVKTLLVDLSVPRNINPTLNSGPCKVLNIDDLNALLEKRIQVLEQKVLQAELILTKSVKRSCAIFRTKSSVLPMALSC
ncbi:MAG: hypothetical protein LLF94_08865 [Chlamydiales bacterium]|nr:hypothetical protein [Chlamydiales bacterium]